MSTTEIRITPKPYGTSRQTYLASSTGMLHLQGCPALTVLKSQITILSEDAAAKVTLRCERCTPRPHGMWVAQDARQTPAERAEVELAELHAKRVARDAEWAGSHTDECDAAIRVFCETDDQATYDAMIAALPHAGYSYPKRATELGVSMP